MYLFAMLMRSGIFAEGRFLGKILDEWIVDAQEFIHTKLPRLIVLFALVFIFTRINAVVTRRVIAAADRKGSSAGRQSQVKTFANILRTTLNALLWGLASLQFLAL